MDKEMFKHRTRRCSAEGFITIHNIYTLKPILHQSIGKRSVILNETKKNTSLQIIITMAS